MKKKQRALLPLIGLSLSLSILSQVHKIDRSKVEKLIHSVSDSGVEQVHSSKLLADTLYLQMLYEGWSMEEISRLLDTYLSKNMKELRSSSDFILYAKDLKAAWNGSESLSEAIGDVKNEKHLARAQQGVRAAFTNADEYLPRKFYNPNDRKMTGGRDAGRFRQLVVHPSGGRIHWIAVHPEDPDKLMVVPDGDGIWRTDNCGKSWDCVTDRIPNRFHRSSASGYAIPVDPDDWNHFFAFMSNGNPVYETFDGGESWTQVEGATHKGFKRAYAFKDKSGKLKFIGANPNENWNSRLWISEDKGVTWREIIIPEEDKDIHPVSGKRGFWFQEFAFDADNRDIVYVPTSRSILQSSDGGNTFRKMQFKVYNQDRSELRSDTTVFPLKSDGPMYLNVNPSNPSQMWATGGIRSGNQTALYYSEDKGQTWITLNEPSGGIGSGTVFGNEVAWVWLGGFGVNYADPSYIYGCSMSSSISSDGGRNFNQYSWGNRMQGYYPDGSLHYVAVSRHNADNHVIASHKSGRVFRGSDGGMLMVDETNRNRWMNIAGNMGQMLVYHIQVNEFGQQAVIQNTQDIDAHSYREGRWSQWQGYEGSTAFMNPYSGEEYHSGTRGGRTYIENEDYNSWNRGWGKADVCSGNWYLRRESRNANKSRFGVIRDFGRTSEPVDPFLGNSNNRDVRDFALARDKKEAVVYTLLFSREIFVSMDGGKTYEGRPRPKDINKPTANADFDAIAVNPDNHLEVFAAGTSRVYRSTDGCNTWTDLTLNLPSGMGARTLYYHEGTGDLYLVCPDHGIFYCRNEESTGYSSWKLWMKGYNPAAFTDAFINYTTQEMYIADYGRGVWAADLERPADRYFRNNFKLKEISHKDGKRTIGIDTHWTIPMFYKYTWKVNGKVLTDQNAQYLTAPLQAGDRISLELQVIESPDVKTSSAELIIGDSENVKIPTERGNAIYSNGKGRIDLGYVDLFRNEFTIDFWAKVEGKGVIIANRQLNYCATKGWLLRAENGELKLSYYPNNHFPQPNNETAVAQEGVLSAGRIGDDWCHIAFTQKQDGNVALYVNGEKRAESARIQSQYDLNNSVYLSLFADGYEHNAIKGAVDELRIFRKALTEDEVRKNMYTLRKDDAGQLAFYHSFNGTDPAGQEEAFTRSGMQARTRAEVTFEPSLLSIGGEYADVQDVSSERRQLFADKGYTFVQVQTKGSYQAERLLAVRYDDDFTFRKNATLNEEYHKVLSKTYLFESRSKEFKETDSIQADFLLTEQEAADFAGGRVYATSRTGDKTSWRYISELRRTDQTAMLSASFRMSDIDGCELALVQMKPAIELDLPSDQYVVRQPGKNELLITARILKSLKEPVGAYSLKSSQAGVTFSDPLYFVNKEAQTKLRFTDEILGAFGEKRQIELTGSDGKTIPYFLNVRNEILSKENTTYLRVDKGGVIVGDAERFSAIHLSNTLTFAGWFRIDTTTMFSGMRPLIMFRGGGASLGVQLEGGELRCHWNEESWSWSSSTGLRVNREMQGQWFHVAFTADPKGVTFYLNGQSSRISRTLNPTRVGGALMLGKNNGGDTYFKGAFDEFSVWSRTLGKEEIIALMHQTPVSEENLICYLPFDSFDEAGNPVEKIKSTPVNLSGTTDFVKECQIPFGKSNRTVFYNNTLPGDTLNLKLQIQGYTHPYYLTYLREKPSGLTNGQSTDFRPLDGGSYLIAYDKVVAASDRAMLTLAHPSLEPGDYVRMAYRPLGSSAPFEYDEPLVVSKAGTVTFELKYKSALQIAFLHQSATNNETPRLHFECESPRVILESGQTEIPLTIRLLSGDPLQSVHLNVEEEYAQIASEDIRFDDTYVIQTKIVLDKSAMNKFAVNPVTVTAMGASAESLVIETEFEPFVEIRLANGEERISTQKPRFDLEIETEWLQGVPNGKVEFETVSDANTSLMTSLGHLLSNESFSGYSLNYATNADEQLDNGFNLIGNPYLSDINLTKEDNVTFENMSRFVYSYDPAEKSFHTYDMTFYDEAQKVKPMSAFFVQALSDQAILRIHEKAKQKVLNKRNTKELRLREDKFLRLRLWVDGKPADRLMLSFTADAEASGILNEDAPKMLNFERGAHQLFTKVGKYKLAVDCRPVDQRSVFDLGVMLGECKSVELEVDASSFNWEMNKIRLLNKRTNQYTDLASGSRIILDAAAAIAGDYALEYLLVPVSGESLPDQSDYVVSVEGKQMTVRNLQGDAHVSVYSMTGKQMVAAQVREERFSTMLEPGVYIIRVIEKGIKYSSKFIVK